MSKKTPFSKKRCHFWFWAISAETTIFIGFWAKTDSVHEHARFSPFLTQIVSGNLLKILFFDFSHFWMTTLKTLFFYRVFWPFPFCLFFFFLFLFLQHKKDKNKKCNFLFENLILTYQQFCKNTILEQCNTICVYKHTQKHYKNGKTVNKKLGPALTLKPPNLGPVFNFTAHIYIYI